MKVKLQTLAFLVASTIFVYLPLILNPSKLLSRGNDLEEQFWPVFYFIRQNFWETKSLPFWNNVFLSGTPIIPDPQFSLFYPFNWLFILLPTDLGFLVWLILHGIIGAIGFYLLLRLFRLSAITARIGALLYLASPSLANFLEAGHYGLAGTLAWLPYLVISVYLVTFKPSYKWAILYSVSLAGLFYTHSIIFFISLLISLLLFVSFPIRQSIPVLLKRLKLLAASLTVCLALVSITLFPQIEWSKTTTRFLLLSSKETYPQWENLQDFLSGIMPYVFGINKIQSTETEKWLVLGPTLILLSLAGFFKLKKSLRLLLLLGLTPIFFILLNNISPFYNLLLSVDLFVLSRVSTRIWFVVIILSIVLACITLESLLKKRKSLYFLLSALVILESLTISWFRIEKDVPIDNRAAPKEVYEYLAQDKGLFRVFCTTRCLSQKEAAIYNLQLIEGYNTLIQSNYHRQMWQFTGEYWNYYSLASPPPGIYLFKQIKPDSVSLGEYNNKYIVSEFEIKDENLVLLTIIKNYKIYKNLKVKSRAYYLNSNLKPSKDAVVEIFEPNYIRVNTENKESNHLVLAEVYSQGWEAYLDGKEKVNILERPNALRLVNLKPNTQFVEFKYELKLFQFSLKN